MSDSPEQNTLRKCIPELETALKGCRRELVHFLENADFISTSEHDEILNPRTTLTEAERAGELVKWIRNRVKQDRTSFQTLLEYFKQGGKLYQSILVILETEYHRNVKVAHSDNCQQQHPSSPPTSSQVTQQYQKLDSAGDYNYMHADCSLTLSVTGDQ